ncbi:7172_t:CDS:2 [Funneliformis caledonium]|uniref:7172_t:CDS:1 n=1 Tax=Funneliformis caledonium TaxID=1117310 RepID=A0A9N9HR99_9GLOM|nr:7172_t:CDS:2 [Funneliformis caledonium]
MTSEIPILQKARTYRASEQSEYHKFFKVTDAENWNFPKFVTFLINTKDSAARPRIAEKAWSTEISKLARNNSIPSSIRKFTSELLSYQFANSNCTTIQSAIKSLEEYSTSMLIIEPRMTLAKQVAKESEALCSITITGKRDRVFSSYMSEELYPKNQKVDQYDPINNFLPDVFTSSCLSDGSNDGTFGSPKRATSKRDQENDEEQKQKKKVCLHKEKSKKTSRKRGNILPDGTKIEKAAPLNLSPSDESEGEVNEDKDDEDEENDVVPSPDGIFDFPSSNLQKWSLPSGESVEGIFATNISESSKSYKQKKRPTFVEKAILRYGASRIIDLSAQMRSWFSPTDRQFMVKDYEAFLKIPELPDEVNTFILDVEKMVHQGRPDAAFKLCTEKYNSSLINSCINKISKIYGELTIDGDDMLECDSIGHTEIDIIVKAFSYIVDGLNKTLGIRQKWGESFCPLSKSTNFTKGRKCDVRFLSSSGMDLGEWEFAVRATSDKTISDRCRSCRINQSILNGLLRLDWKDERVNSIKVPFIQFAGVNGQMLIEDQVNGFYVVFPGQKFQLPTKLAQIEKLKSSVKITKYVMDMYKETSDLINNLEVGYHEFDGIFGIDEPDTSISVNYKSCICDPWWTPKKQKQ